MLKGVFVGNEKIAELLGMQQTTIGWYDAEENLRLDYTKDNTFDDLLFNKSWDWLMSAVEFIESIKYGIFQVDILQDGCKIKLKCIDIIDMTVSKLPDGTTKKESVWMAIDEFTGWYEKNKNNIV